MSPPRAPATAAAPDAIEHLQAALSELLGAERRLRGRANGELTVNDIRALAWLARHGPSTPGELARETDLKPASVTGMLDHLEGLGLLQRERSSDDRRVVDVTLTERGREVVAIKRRHWQRRWREALADVPPHELEAATRVLERIAGIYDGLRR